MTLNDRLARISLASGLTLALLIGMSAAATAQEVTVVTDRADEPEYLTERVTYDDLKLETRDGQHVLNRRVRRASVNVCKPVLGTQANGICRNYAWRGAKPQIDLAVTRAKEIALTGTSSIAPVAIAITAPQ